eukprot:349747_1
MSRQHHNNPNLKKSKPKQSSHMMAINVMKGLFKHQTLNQLPMPLAPEDLEDIGRVLEDIIASKSSVPSFIVELFGTSINNMFGELNIDFNLLNNDYLYVKSVFVLHGESDNSCIHFDRVMKLIESAKIDTLRVSNVRLTRASFDCIINYIGNDDNYGADNRLRNSVNQMILHRKSGLQYAQIVSIYGEQFTVCGWEMSYDEKTCSVTMTLNASSFDYYAQDYDGAGGDGYEYYYDDEYEYYYDEPSQPQQQQQQQPPPPTRNRKESEIGVVKSPPLLGRTSVRSPAYNVLPSSAAAAPPPPVALDPVEAARNKYKFLSEVLCENVLFSGFLAEAMQVMQRMDVVRGQCIMKETEYGQKYDLKFFVIESGSFDLFQRGKKLSNLCLSRASIFGESQLTYGIPQYVTIRASSAAATAWYMNRTQYVQLSRAYFHGSPFKNRTTTPLASLEHVTTLGAGSFGRVLLVRDPFGRKKRTYSLKKIGKNAVIRNKQQEHILNERSVLAAVSRKRSGKYKKFKSFCCKLYGTYQDEYYLYFLMEPLLGGELFTLLRHNGVFSESVARFYFSCVIVAFDHLHSLNIIYRDIKPENIMLCSNGYAKLVDYGFAKLRNESVTLCGTPEYLAPEVIQNYWQGFEIDYWGAGILLYEMLAGQPPFESYQQILTQPVPHIVNKKQMTPQLTDLINKLLVKNPYQRLGTTYNDRNGVDDIYKHEWFEGKIDWNAFKHQKFRPPYIPDIQGDDDATNFEQINEKDINKQQKDSKKK